MPHSKRLDTWKKLRRRCDHFTQIERDFIQQCFLAKRRTFDVARDLQCSQRMINTHYAAMRGRPTPKTPRSSRFFHKNERVKRAAPPRESRFYHSDFTLDDPKNSDAQRSPREASG